MDACNFSRAAVMGGTFDPVHYGHLLAAESVKEKLNLDCIFFIPAGNPPHKSYEGMASPIHRYNMVDCAVRPNPSFRISDIEVKREGYSYTIDTVNQLSTILPKGCKAYFVLGADNAGDILRWKDALELIKRIDFLVVTRPGGWENGLKEELNILSNAGCNIDVVEIPMIPITSTEIRDRVKSRRSIRYMVPECVEQYIYENRLYT